MHRARTTEGPHAQGPLRIQGRVARADVPTGEHIPTPSGPASTPVSLSNGGAIHTTSKLPLLRAQLSGIQVTWLCNHHLRPSPELSHVPKLKLCPHLPPPRPSWPLTPTTLHSVSRNLTAPGTSQKWNHTVSSSCGWNYLTECNVLRVHLCHSLWRMSLLFKANKPSFGWITCC